MRVEHQTYPLELKLEPRHSNPITPYPAPKGLAARGGVGHEPNRGSNLFQKESNHTISPLSSRLWDGLEDGEAYPCNLKRLFQPEHALPRA